LRAVGRGRRREGEMSKSNRHVAGLLQGQGEERALCLSSLKRCGGKNKGGRGENPKSSISGTAERRVFWGAWPK